MHSGFVEVDVGSDGEHRGELDAVAPAVSGARRSFAWIEEEQAGLVVADAGVDGADADGHLEQRNDVKRTHGGDDGVEIVVREVIGGELGVERVEGDAGWVGDEAVVLDEGGDDGVLEESVVEAEVLRDTPLRDELNLG